MDQDFKEFLENSSVPFWRRVRRLLNRPFRDEFFGNYAEILLEEVECDAQPVICAELRLELEKYKHKRKRSHTRSS